MATRATLNGSFSEFGLSEVVEKGFYYGTNSNPGENDSKILATGSRDDFIQLFDTEKKVFLDPLENKATLSPSMIQ